MGYNGVDLRVENGLVTVNDYLYSDTVDAHTWAEHSSVYDKSAYGPALDHVADCSKTVTVDADGQEVYDHDADPEFLQLRVTVKDYDRYTEEDAVGPNGESIKVRVYDTHEETRSNLGMKVAWLRQCVYELKQENETLKTRLAALEAAVQGK